jgi:hypothetical protein
LQQHAHQQGSLPSCCPTSCPLALRQSRNSVLCVARASRSAYMQAMHLLLAHLSDCCSVRLIRRDSLAGGPAAVTGSGFLTRALVDGHHARCMT